jgi:hypothetical protein
MYTLNAEDLVKRNACVECKHSHLKCGVWGSPKSSGKGKGRAVSRAEIPDDSDIEVMGFRKRSAPETEDAPPKKRARQDFPIPEDSIPLWARAVIRGMVKMGECQAGEFGTSVASCGG